MTMSPQVRFYLKHHRQIEEWCRIGDQAKEETHAFMKALKPELEGLQRVFQQQILVNEEYDEKYEAAFVLYRPTWHILRSSTVRAGIGVGWSKEPVALENAYYGVYLNADHRKAPALRQQLERTLAGVDWPGKDAIEPEDAFWPLWTYHRVQDHGFEDLDAFRRDFLQSVEDFWRLFAPAIDEAIDKAP